MSTRLNVINYFFAFVGFCLIVPMVISCSKSNNSLPTQDLPQLNFIYLSPDANPVNLYASNVVLNSDAIYRYPNSSGYFTLSNIGSQLITVRSASVGSPILDTLTISANPSVKYTLFETGLLADSSALQHIFVVDTAALPIVGRGKVRFVNASPRSGGFDVAANGTIAFKNIAFKKVSPYVEMPSGNYNFQIYQTGNTNTVIYSLPTVPVSDGGLYTIYTYGLQGHTDTAAFAASVITNK